MSSKRRFGVSVPEDLVRDLDRLASQLGSTRSNLVVEALREFVHDRIHVSEPHFCRGVLLITSSSRVADKLAMLYEKYSEVIKARMHYHCEESCIDLLIIEAKSDKIFEFERMIRNSGADRVRYTPLSWSIED